MANKVGVGFGVMLLKDNKILLGKRHDDPEKADSELHGEGTWTMPGGGLHFGETFEEGAYREVLEETGIEISTDSMQLISLSNDKVEDAHFVTIGFLITEWKGEASVMEPDEITEWDWFDLDHLPSPLFICTERLLNRYREQTIYRPED